MKILSLRRNPFRRYPGAIYAIDTSYWSAIRLRDHVRTGYVGKTRQRVHVRIWQHRVSQPWSDLIEGYRVLWQGQCSDFHLWWLEIYYILTRFPVYNYQWNRLNPRRVPIFKAQADRARRDRFGRKWVG